MSNLHFRPTDAKKIRITEAGQPCRHCGTPVVRETHSKPPKYKPGGYYFLFWFRCPRCRTFFMVESAKRFFDNEQPQQKSLLTPVEQYPD
jgi:hypothetical protein